MLKKSDAIILKKVENGFMVFPLIGQISGMIDDYDVKVFNKLGAALNQEISLINFIEDHFSPEPKK
jgi:hypothetical protein